MRSIKILSILLLMVSVMTSCYYDTEEELYPTITSCDTTKLSFQNTIFPIINSKCNLSGCHNAATQSAGLNFETYSGIKAVINDAKFLGSLKHVSPYSAMPKGASKLSVCDIMKIEQWKNNGSPNN